MDAVFADTSYYIALVNPRDAHHAIAEEITVDMSRLVVTTSAVLTEFANFMSHGSNRLLAAEMIQQLRSDPDITVEHVDRELFDAGYDLYCSRHDKSWSLTDCIAFVVMERRGIVDALTADNDFRQAGFNALMA